MPWVLLGVVGFVIVLAFVVVWTAGRRPSESARERDGSERSKASERPRPELIPAFHGLNPTEAKIVGTWSEGAFVRSSLARVKGTTTCRADGTFESSGTIDTAEIGTISGTFSGTWKLQGDTLIWKVSKERWSHPTLFLTDVFPDGKLLEGMNFAEQFVSVSATHLITKDTETGQTFVAERIR
jgi:cellulase/cellobiase CelA1